MLENKSWITYTNHFLRTVAYHGSLILSVRRLLNLLRIHLLLNLDFWCTWSHIKWIFNKLLILILLIEIILSVIDIIFNLFLIYQRFLNLLIYIKSIMLHQLCLILYILYFLMILLSIHNNRFVFFWSKTEFTFYF